MMVSGAGTKSYFHQNHLYSVAAMTNSTGAVVERYRYDAYGKRTVTNAAGTAIAASTIGQQRGFTGYYLDAETGLYYARRRLYDASLGRWLRRDPVGYEDGMSLYRAYYIPNDLDPSGTLSEKLPLLSNKNPFMPAPGIKITIKSGTATLDWTPGCKDGSATIDSITASAPVTTASFGGFWSNPLIPPHPKAPKDTYKADATGNVAEAMAEIDRAWAACTDSRGRLGAKAIYVVKIHQEVSFSLTGTLTHYYPQTNNAGELTGFGVQEIPLTAAFIGGTGLKPIDIVGGQYFKGIKSDCDCICPKKESGWVNVASKNQLFTPE